MNSIHAGAGVSAGPDSSGVMVINGLPTMHDDGIVSNAQSRVATLCHNLGDFVVRQAFAPKGDKGDLPAFVLFALGKVYAIPSQFDTTRDGTSPLV